MKLSEAIRLESLVLKPLKGNIFSEDRNSGCAVGMALVAIGENKSFISQGLANDAFLKHFPIERLMVLIPASVCVSCDMLRIIIYLFDCCNWSPEQIASWIEQYEETPEMVNETKEEMVGVA